MFRLRASAEMVSFKIVTTMRFKLQNPGGFLKVLAVTSFRAFSAGNRGSSSSGVRQLDGRGGDWEVCPVVSEGESGCRTDPFVRRASAGWEMYRYMA